MPEKKIAPLTCEQLMEFSESSREALACFAEILRNNQGCNTPAEEFITGLVNYHAEWGGITPAFIDGRMPEFRENFELAVDAARAFARNYPAETLGEDCGGWGDQFQTLKEIAIQADSEAGWAGQAENRIEIAREAIRQYPALALSDDSWEEIKKSMRP